MYFFIKTLIKHNTSIEKLIYSILPVIYLFMYFILFTLFTFLNKFFFIQS